MTQTLKSERYFEVGDSDGNEITLVARTPEAVELASRIYDECPEDGVIQPQEMVGYFPGQPTLHTTMRLHHALLKAGCELCED